MIESRPDIAVGLGGNLPFEGSPTSATLVRAIGRLDTPDITIRAVSRFYATPCFPAGAGPDYVNAAVLIRSALTPRDLLQRLHDIEHEFGRARAQRWGMRTLDMDILFHGQSVLPDAAGQRAWVNLPPEKQVRATPDHLILPHPRLQDRAFALVPLADVAPEWRHPLLQKTVLQLCQALPREEIAAVRPL
ncbi:2-amino-4-hydroxy-6-hydroxymethyldihydropteridine diphosphokinase [Rhodobacteraceae bacterium F11138]|nr:2-amino-4-hydroxy-6-hydroxymethyldihydropteridine diphosphokinase [Rhodobacteraceae bacterium F11138]